MCVQESSGPIAVTIFGQTRDLTQESAQWIADELEAGMERLADLTWEIIKLRDIGDLRRLQHQTATERIDSILAAKHPTDLHVEALEKWTRVRETIPIERG